MGQHPGPAFLPDPARKGGVQTLPPLRLAASCDNADGPGPPRPCESSVLITPEHTGLSRSGENRFVIWPQSGTAYYVLSPSSDLCLSVCLYRFKA